MSRIDASGLSILDAHTHVFPPEIVAGRADFCLRDGWFSILYENPRARLASVEDLIDSMDAAGIGQALICGFPWFDSGLCDLHNDYMHEAVSRFPQRLEWLGIVSPGHGSQLERVTEDLLNRGARGIGELNADAQRFNLMSPDVIQSAFAVCQEWRRPVMLHASEPVGHDYPGKGAATPGRLLNLISHYPQLTFVLAHWGGGLPFYELMPEVRAALANVYYDTAATTYLYDFEVFRHVIAIAGAEKVLFASDDPVLGQERLLKKVLSLPWTDPSEQAAVLYGNAARIYGMPLSEVEQA